MLDFAAKSQLSNGAMTLTLARIARDAEGVCVIPPVIGEAMTIVGAATPLQDAMAKHGGKYVVVPINLGNNHWCGLLVDIGERRVVYYDPMTSSSATQARDFTLAKALLLKETIRLCTRYAPQTRAWMCKPTNTNAGSLSCCSRRSTCTKLLSDT